MISFVIPAFNEATIIGETLKTLHRFGPAEAFEVLLVDNGSTDNTMEVAKNNGATVIQSDASTIAAVRNHGVLKSVGDIIIFIDADVLLTKEWQENIDEAIQELRSKKLTLTGCRCHPPTNNNWFNKYWFKLMTSQATSYINSGHLIVTRTLFDKISGFNEQLNTAEDHDFCQRAIAVGANMAPNFRLVTIHDGYPTTIAQFVKRERWHGREDYESFSAFVHSKIAIIATGNLILFAIAVALALITTRPSVLICYAITMLLACAALSFIKFGLLPIRSIIPNTFIHFVYFWGRGFALIDRLTGKYSSRFREQG